jgi:hypothetical protein
MSSRDKTATAVHGEPERTNVQQAAQRPPGAARTIDTTAVDKELPTRRLNVMRFGYAFMGVGLAIVKWPILIQDARSLPALEAALICLLTGMSLLALLGLRYPVRMLPILVLDVVFKAIWFAAVAIPHLVADDMDAATSDLLFSCSFAVILLVVIPWGYVWRRYARTAGDAWR